MTAGGKAAPGDSWPEDLLGPLRNLPAHRKLWVALSGGLDSSLLLHVVAERHPDVTALHINHQLQPNHLQTEQACRALCVHLGVPLEVRRVSVVPGRGGLELAARDARYQAFHELLQTDDLLLMAHHADDQAETVVFRLLRGTGVNGLGGMPVSRPLGAGALWRPWLGVARERLFQVATERGVSWVEDPSNQSDVHDRNYLRLEVMSGLKQRWPGLLQRIARSARACAESEQLNRRLAELQWQSCSDDRGRIELPRFASLGALERVNLVRWWIAHRGFPVPGLARWEQVLGELIEAAPDKLPELQGEGFAIRRYRQHLYLVPDFQVPETPCLLEPDTPLCWGSSGWVLMLTPGPEWAGQACPEIRVSTRQGGERLRLADGQPSRVLKTWLQEQGVPPWERAALPLAWGPGEGADDLVAVGDLWCSERYSEGAHAAGWRLVVKRDCD
ncbi:tRNA lysidine(34) synthetase TilS [Marinobacter fuscus]|uniref:tRNA(Ile)-lysidine synthase n=1 Tax=Marinobacter fuscus TaxID=2109942 RepID=A0A2T1K5C0_9GAMM|nr:tRNA lysidine(34) synthetase TilS [Marinobacter fuscus]PSF05341.1 tRNA lysidine(34) synthetase TilS [Marinobacter fuscus]